MIRRAAILATTVLFALGLPQGPVASSGTSANWPTYLFNDQHSSFNAAANTITPSNASDLTPGWTFAAPQTPNSPPTRLYASPTVADGKIYVGSNDGQFYRLDEATGAVDWQDA